MHPIAAAVDDKAPSDAPAAKDEAVLATPTAGTKAASSSSHSEEEETKALSETMPIWAVFLVVLGILMSLFLVALDRTIVSTVCTYQAHAMQSVPLQAMRLTSGASRRTI